MAGFKLNLFSGLRPRIPESLLREGEATEAKNCDFAYGELRNTKDGYAINGAPMYNTPASLYTDDGLTFFTWANDVDAVRSPLANDTFNRMYYTDGSTMRVANRMLASTQGGEPGGSYKVGVPRPSESPTLTVMIPNVTDSKFTYAFKFHYEYGGVKYQEQDISLSQIDPGKKWGLIVPTIISQAEYSNKDSFPAEGVSGVIYKASDTGKYYTWSGAAYAETTTSGTPSGASPVLSMTVNLAADGSEFFKIYSDNSSMQSSLGIWTLSLTKDSTPTVPTRETYTVTLSTAIKESDKEARAYVYTYVNTYNEEGPPSDPTIVTTSPVVDVIFECRKDAVSGYAPIKEVRIYRTPSGSTVADYFYVGSISALGEADGVYLTFTDDVNPALLNEALSSTYYFPPPDGLFNIMSLPNGILAALKGNELWFSEAYKPWAWNPSYTKTLPATAVGGIAHGSGAVITTVKQPILVSGVSPDSMTATRLNVDQAGVSKWSIAVVDGVVAYASHDGIVILNGGQASLAQSQKFFTREVWRTLYRTGLTTMRFSVWDGRLVVFSSTGAFTPFMIRFDEADGTMTELPTLTARCGFVSVLSDQFYYANGRYIYQFNGGNDLTATWASRELVVNKPVNFGFGQAVVSGAWVIEFYANGALVHTQLVAPGTTNFRMPSGFLADRWKFRIYGTGRFRELRIAPTAKQLETV